MASRQANNVKVPVPEEGVQVVMFYLTNWRVFWRIDNWVGDRFLDNTYLAIPDGWQVIEASVNLEMHRGWKVCTCGAIVPASDKRLRELRAKIKAQGGKPCGDA
jgi:hypothetical protein